MNNTWDNIVSALGLTNAIRFFGILGIILIVIGGIVITASEKSKKRLSELKKEKVFTENNTVNGIDATYISTRNALEKNKHVGTFVETLKSSLTEIGWTIPVDRFILIWISLIFAVPIIAVMLGANVLIALLIIVVAAIGPYALIVMKKQKRTKQIEDDLVDALGVIMNALKAGHSFQQSLQMVGTEMQGPIASEFNIIYEETQYGMPVDTSLERFAERTGSKYIAMLATSVGVQMQVGGNIVAVLGIIIDTIRTRQQMEKKIQAKTASGKASGILVGSIPIVLLAFMAKTNPDYISMFFTTLKGGLMLGAGAVLEIIGALIIKKILKVDF